MVMLNSTPNPDLVAVKAEIDPEAKTLAEKLTVLIPVAVCAANRAAFAAFLAEVKGTSRRLDERKKLITKPMRNALASVNTLFDGPMDVCAALEKLIKDKLGVYDAECDERAAMAETRAAELVAAGDLAGAQAALAELAAPVEEVDGLSVRDEWDYEIINAGLIPTPFMIPNRPLIRTEMRRQVKQRPTEAPEILGVKFFQKKIVASKST